MHVAYDYVQKHGGQVTEKSYPTQRKGHRHGRCRKSNDVGAKCRGFKSVKFGDENDLKTAIATEV